MSEEDDYNTSGGNINHKSITCENIPDIFLEKLAAKKHFSKFGKVKRFILRPKRLSCTVEYEKEDDAEDAIVNAGLYNGQQFLVKYTTNEVAHTRNTEEWVDSEVQAELDAMRPQGRLGPHTGSRSSGAAKAPKPILKLKNAGSDSLAKIADNSLRTELETILKRQAFDNEDKFRILDARDRLIRYTTTRTTDIKRAKSIKGFCPDMCPEKERLLRENRNQIAVFEVDEHARNQMNHKLAVKEYSRSSADQETPLSHELRSEPVLKLTMTYLMHKVMNLCDSDDTNIADWYHFIWDRTRSIRKDITQQELCSLASVELVEQCARFHIHCAARLIAEESSVFDQKINTENLTKCLQTLKYMYHDLRLQGKRCPNEAEFRSYVVLLNLNDTNFLWEVNQLPQEIQNSKPIRFALATYLAMEGNNYVRFFKLVREASYMNACILLRYFTQVRIQAIRAIMIAYKWPLHVVSIPVSYFRKILAFESDEAARMFFEYHGLDCEGNRVNLDKKTFYLPEMPYPLDRAFDLVEAKCKCTVGEAVCGHPLDAVEMLEKYSPHNSFDENGYLKGDAWNAEDQKYGEQKNRFAAESDGLFKVPSASPPISPRFKSPSPGLKLSSDGNKLQLFQPISKLGVQQLPTSALPTKPFGTMSEDHPAAKFSLPNLSNGRQDASQNKFKTSIFGGATKEASQPIATSIFTNSKFASSVTPSNASSSSVFGPTTDVFKHFQTKAPDLDVFGIANNFASSKKSHEDEAPSDLQQREELEKIRRKKTRADEEERERHMKLLEQKKVDEMAEKKYQEKLEKIENTSHDFLSEILEEGLSLTVKEIASTELRKYQSLLHNAERIYVELACECIGEFLVDALNEEIAVFTTNRSLMRKYFKLWHENARHAVQHRKLMESTPIWISDEFVTDAHPQQNETLEMRERYLRGVPGQFEIRSPREKPINIFSIFRKAFRSKMPPLESGHLINFRKYLKYVISIPKEDEELKGLNSYINSWLNKTIKRNTTEEIEEFLCESQDDISICIRKVEGIVAVNEKNKTVSDEVDHAHGLIFVMSSTNLLNARKRLHHILKLSKIYVKIPLAIIVYNSTANEEHIEEELQIQRLIDDDKVSYYSVFPTTVFINKNNLREAFEETFKFIAEYTDQKYDCEMQSFCSFLRSTLGDEFWKRLADSALINPSFRKLCTQHKKIVSLYNEAIDILVHILENDQDELPEFPRELRKFVPKQILDIPLDIEHFPSDWKAKSRKQKIQSFLKSLKLKLPPDFAKNLVEIERSLLEYSSKCITSEVHAKRAGYNAIKHLLESLNSPELQVVPDPERLDAINWLPVVQSISLELLTYLWNSKHSSLPREIIYKKLAFREYIGVPWWFENITLKSIKMESKKGDTENEGLGPPSPKRPKICEISADIDSLLQRSTALLEKADRNIEKYRAITSKSREISRSLDEEFYKQEIFNRKLKRYFQSNK